MTGSPVFVLIDRFIFYESIMDPLVDDWRLKKTVEIQRDNNASPI
jgi:hypothetical protein